MNLKAVIFDFDDTLVDTEGFVLKHLEKTSKKLGLKFDNEEREFTKKILSKNLPFEKLFEELFPGNWEKVLNTYREDSMNTKYEAKSKMKEYISTLLVKNIKLYILSNRFNKLEERLEQAGFNPQNFSIYSAPVDCRKPNLGAYKEVIEEIEDQGINKDETLIIGNHPDDYLALPDDWKERFRAVFDTEERLSEFRSIPGFRVNNSFNYEINKINK